MMIPDPNVSVWVSARTFSSTPSANRRLPLPRTIECTMNRYRSMRFACFIAVKSCPLPESRRSWPGSCCSFAHLLGNVACDQPGAGPVNPVQRRGDHVLGHAVHLVGEPRLV